MVKETHSQPENNLNYWQPTQMNALLFAFFFLRENTGLQGFNLMLKLVLSLFYNLIFFFFAVQTQNKNVKIHLQADLLCRLLLGTWTCGSSPWPSYGFRAVSEPIKILSLCLAVYAVLYDQSETESAGIPQVMCKTRPLSLQLDGRIRPPSGKITFPSVLKFKTCFFGIFFECCHKV